MKRQKGLTMVELMVAIALSLLVADAAVSLFLANKNTSSTTNGVAAISDNGRLALNLIGQSVRSAGYMACNSLNAGAGTIPVSAAPQSSTMAAGATPVQRNYGVTATAFGGYEAGTTGPSGGSVTLVATPVADTGAGDWAGGGLDALLTANTAAVPGVVKGTDVLVVREQLPQAVTMYTAALYAAGAGALTVNDASSLAGLALPHAAVVSSCGSSAATMITNVVGPTLTISAGGLSLPFNPYSSVAPIDTLIFYVGPGRDGDGALFVWDDGSSGAAPFSTEMVPDVENMQVLYGVAPTTANQVTVYETADTVAAAGQFNQVISVKVALLLASPPLAGAIPVPTTAPTFNLLGATITAPKDNRLRKVFDVTIAARNATH